MIAVGPNIKYLHGQYWDFFDHHVYLTEASLGEALEIEGYQIERILPRFLPFTMVKAPEYPMFFVRLYIELPWFWRVFGQYGSGSAEKRFLIVNQQQWEVGMRRYQMGLALVTAGSLNIIPYFGG